jgi:succinate dehydrogenase flavin-adding protein (antitoxin of CptAB toxin-antitoxin module)
MEGTVDTVDVLNWIMFCQQFVERSLVEKAADISKKETALELIDFLESKDQGLISWILGRIKRFA